VRANGNETDAAARGQRGKTAMRRRCMIAGAVGLALLAVWPAPARAQLQQDDGVKVGRPSFVRRLVSAAQLEEGAKLQYVQLRDQAVGKGVLAGPNDPQRKRVERITSELLPHVAKWNDRAKDWHWETMVIKSRTINAFCMPGGKIAVFSGLLDSLQLSDDEAAMVIGHEMAHALREHSRARAAKATLTTLGAGVVALLIGGNVGEIARVGGGLLTLRFSRNDEKEADLIGMELAARAGHDPRAGLTLWEKMSNAAKGAPPQWLSTHPSGATRVQLIKDNLKYVLPLFERAHASLPAAHN
jgi:predicted Zn-dependent protease